MAEPFRWLGKGGLVVKRPSLLRGSFADTIRQMRSSAVAPRSAEPLPPCPTGDCGNVVEEVCRAAPDEAACRTDLVKVMRDHAGNEDLESALRDAARRHGVNL